MRTPLLFLVALLAFALTPAVAQPISAADAKSHVGEKVIEAKSDDGIYIGLDDGTKWLVEKSGAPTVRGWVLGEDVAEIGKSKDCVGTRFVDTDEHGEAVCVRDVSADTVPITAISEDHEHLALHDGSKRLLPSYGDRSTAFAWHVGDHVLYIQDAKTCSNVEMINVDEYGEEVCADSVS